MAKLTLTDIVSGYASTTMINANNALIEAALENTLSRDGTTPNTMSADIDMNTNRIINLEAPAAANDAARLADVQSAVTTGLPDQTGHAGKFLQTDGAAVTFQVPDATEVSNTPAGNIVATTVQAAINELDTDVRTVAQGGTGKATITSGKLLVGNGTSAPNETAYTVPTTDGTDGQLLTTDGAGAVTWQTPAQPTLEASLAKATANSTIIMGTATTPIFNAGGGEYIVASNDDCFSSTDYGFTYDAGTGVGSGLTLRGAVKFGSLYVVCTTDVSTQSYIRTSTDRATWTTRATKSISKEFKSLATNGSNLLVAVGEVDGDGAPICMSSADALTWTDRTISSTTIMYAVAYGNGLWVVTGASGEIHTSTDGITWTSRTTPHSVAYRAVRYCGNIWVAVGDADGADAAIATSTDGITWTERSNPVNASLTFVSYVNGNIIAFSQSAGTGSYGGQYMIESTDGITWTEVKTTTRIRVLGLDYDSTNDRYVIVGVDEALGTNAYPLQIF